MTAVILEGLLLLAAAFLIPAGARAIADLLDTVGWWPRRKR